MKIQMLASLLLFNVSLPASLPVTSYMHSSFITSDSDGVRRSPDKTWYITLNTISLGTGNSLIKIQKHLPKAYTRQTIEYHYNNSDSQMVVPGSWSKSFLNGILSYSEEPRRTKSSSVDNRVIADNYLNWQPFTSTGFLTFKDYDTNIVGNGTVFLLGNGYALTAAHCVYFDGKYRRDLKGTFSYENAVETKKTTSNVEEIYVPESWIDSNPNGDTLPTVTQKNNDWAIIKFEDANLKDTFGGLPIASYGEIDTYTNYIALGYPDDKGNKQTYSKGQGLISSTDYRYDLYSFVSGGMSGGPIIAFYEEFDDHINDYVPYSYVIGIISTQEPDIPNSGQCWTGSTKIKNYIINFMEDLSA